MNNSILLLTKDAICSSYWPCYGNQYWKGKTPNLDELVAKGTLFTNAFTAAPSSAMSYLTMFTRMYPYQQKIQLYVPLSKPFDGDTLFDEANKKGYECHVVWDEHWINLAERYSKCYGRNTTMHPLKGLRQGVGPLYKREKPLARNKQIEDETLNMFVEEIRKIMGSGNKIFLWCHLPHVLNGRISYADDVDLFDKYLGALRQFFDDNNIFVSSDHGNMNGFHGKIRYGFDVYEPAIRIPLITPRINGLEKYEEQFCNIDFFELIFDRQVIKRDVIFSDCAYYAQPRRKLAVIFGKYRYIYNKNDRTEELYDVDWDPHQDFNLIDDNCYDVDRKEIASSKELYFYPYWDELPAIREKLRNEKNKIWKEATTKEIIKMKVNKIMNHNAYLKKLYIFILKHRK